VVGSLNASLVCRFILICDDNPIILSNGTRLHFLVLVSFRYFLHFTMRISYLTILNHKANTS
ncbi:MAG: hypothetical protein MR591_05420, partial [Helicobacter sp.]|uniref:hypothetical protein n=1 Tax=Helicobacter sp. TaxID=218 RepID=UPI003751F23B|nr:hypothetical protein [Helicobacter sp.]